MHYLEYYDIEKYLFSTVYERFHRDGHIAAFDFFSIVGWKSNRPKGMIREALRERCQDLDQAVKSLTGDIHKAADHENRLKTLLDVRGIGLPMATAILTVLYPDHFTVYDTRVCNQLDRFSNLRSRPIATIWKGYEEFRQAVREEAVRRGAPESLGLRDMDRWLWTLDVVDQLKREGCTPPSSPESQFRRTPTGMTKDQRDRLDAILAKVTKVIDDQLEAAEFDNQTVEDMGVVLRMVRRRLAESVRESLEHLRTRCLVRDDYGYGYRYLTTLLAETPLEWLDALEAEYVMGDHDVDPDNPNFGWHGHEILRITRESIVAREVTVGSEPESDT